MRTGARLRHALWRCLSRALSELALFADLPDCVTRTLACVSYGERLSSLRLEDETQPDRRSDRLLGCSGCRWPPLRRLAKEPGPIQGKT